MAKCRVEKNYTKDKVSDFLNVIRVSTTVGLPGHTFVDVCKFYKFGHITLQAMRKCGFVKTNGRGFKNWEWLPQKSIDDKDIGRFINTIKEIRAFENKQAAEKKQKTNRPFPPAWTEAKVLNLSDKMKLAKKAVQKDLPMASYRFELLKNIRAEICEARRVVERIVDRLDNIENHFDKLSTVRDWPKGCKK